MASPDETDPPLDGASDSDINKIVDDVLRSGNQVVMEPAEEAKPERYHARAIAQLREVRDDVDEWWLEVAGERSGPLSLKKLRLLWDDGDLTPDTLTWREGMPQWVPLFQISELAGALTPKLDAKRVDDAAEAFKRNSSGEWGSPAGAAMERANRDQLEEARRPAPVDDQRSGMYRIHVEPEPQPPPRRRGFSRAILSGLVAGGVVTGALFTVHLLKPNAGPAVQPIVINVLQPPAPAPTPVTAPVAAPAPVAVAAAPRPVAAPVKKAEPVAEAPPKEPAKPETVDDSFSKTFAGPDELTLGEVFEVVREHKPAVDGCVKAQHAADAEAEGRLVMRWKVDPQGRVSDVTPAEDIALGRCLAKEIAGWSFPKHAVVLDPVEVPFRY